MPREGGAGSGEMFYGCDNESFVSEEREGQLGLNLDSLEYNAASPDEKAILEGCSLLGMKFAGEEEPSNRVKVLDCRSPTATLKTYQRLHSLEFDSERKRMSVIVRHWSVRPGERRGGKLYLVTKGAESSVLPRCLPGPALAQTSQHTHQFATRHGLRTIAVAMKELTELELVQYENSLQQASLSLDQRTERLRAVYDQLETGLVLLGATAIEDKLQAGVADTLDSLARAGVSVWLLTGDKKETAVQVSLAAGHLQHHQPRLDLSGLASPAQLSARLAEVTAWSENNLRRTEDTPGLVVDGETIASVLSSPALRAQFCQAVSSLSNPRLVACRLSPLQKREVVRMMKQAPTRPITAAIGDGGNDVSMIQEAHIGFGIMGKEGRAAVRASDIGFGKFHHLRRVILVHGHWYYYRSAIIVQYSFYKNIACFTNQLYYAFYSNFSNQTMFDGANLTGYNVAFTALPIFIFGLVGRNIPAERLLELPGLYRNNAGNRLLSLPEFLLWFLQAVWHSATIFFGWVALWQSSGGGLGSSSQPELRLAQSSLGLCVYTNLMVVVSLKLLWQASSISLALLLSLLLSFLAFLLFDLAWHSLVLSTDLLNLLGGDYNTAAIPAAPLSPEMFQVAPSVLSSPSVWLAITLLSVLALLPDVLIRIVRKHWAVIRARLVVRRKVLDVRIVQEQYQVNNNNNINNNNNLGREEYSVAEE